MNGLSVIIPSKNAANLVPCIEAIRRHEPSVRIFVVDDGLPDRSVIDAVTIDGVKPFVFARNHNIGIQAAGQDDVVLLNDDALLETPGGFTRMQQDVHDDIELGLISSSTNNAGNPDQLRRPGGSIRVLKRPTPGNSFPTVAFICVLIPRRTLDIIGVLDERFTAYGFEDNDYCRRIKRAGGKIAVHDGCFVDHAKLKSSFRGESRAGGKLEDGRSIYMAKWGSM